MRVLDTPPSTSPWKMRLPSATCAGVASKGAGTQPFGKPSSGWMSLAQACGLPGRYRARADDGALRINRSTTTRCKLIAAYTRLIGPYASRESTASPASDLPGVAEVRRFLPRIPGILIRRKRWAGGSVPPAQHLHPAKTVGDRASRRFDRRSGPREGSPGIGPVGGVQVFRFESTS